LNDAELDDVKGAEGNLANAAIRVVTQWFQDHPYQLTGFATDLKREICP
jgi:hypothetical protein